MTARATPVTERATRGLFITGTDTGVGKTAVGCALARCLRERGLSVGVMKPVESGCTEREEVLVPEDALALVEASNCGDGLEMVCPYRLRAPLAPAVAADKEGVTISFDLIVQNFNHIAASHDFTLVEGVGGLLVPLSGKLAVADLMARLGLPALVVARARLGTINHTLLTTRELERRGIELKGVILNHLATKSAPDHRDNRRLLEELGIPVLAELPCCMDTKQLTEALAEEIDLDSII